MHKLLSLLIFVPSLASANALSSDVCAADSGLCRTWVLHHRKDTQSAVCIGATSTSASVSSQPMTAYILPTDSAYTIRLRMLESARVQKIVNRGDCDNIDREPLLEINYGFEQHVINQVKLESGLTEEFGVLAIKQLGLMYDQYKTAKCDLKFAERVELDFKNGRLAREAIPNYFYHVRDDRLELVFANKEICDTKTGLVKLVFVDESKSPTK